MWKIRQLNDAGKNDNFQICSNFQIIHLAFTNSIFAEITNFLEKIRFFWKSSKRKVKQETLCKISKNGGLKKVNVVLSASISLTVSVVLQFLWLKKSVMIDISNKGLHYVG